MKTVKREEPAPKQSSSPKPFCLHAFLHGSRSGIVAAAAVCFIALVYGPVELYLTNRSDFWFGPGVLLPDVILLFVMGLAGCILLLALTYRFAPRLHTAFTAALVWGMAVCYVQNNFLSGWLPSMDGTTIDWNAYPGQRAASAALCVLAAAAVILLTRKKWLDKAALAELLLTLVLLVTLITLGIASTSSAGSYYFSTNEGLEEYSTDQNFVILVVDSVDGDTFAELVDESAEYREALRDFTYYSDSLSAYPYTYYAITQLLTGQWYTGGKSFESFRAQALCESPLFSSLQERGYRMGIYLNEQTFDNHSEAERFYNLQWEAPEITSHSAFWRVILRMSCVKNAPFDLKRLGYSLPEKLNGLKLGDREKRDAAFSVSNRDFVDFCGQRTRQCADKMFKYIHIEGAHVPFQYGPQLQDVSGTDQATYRNNVAGTIYTISTYLDMLRQEGVYDNTAILILSDHGYTEDLDDSVPGGHNIRRRHSILLAKGFAEEHDYTVNDAPLSFGDLQDIYQRMLDGSSGSELIDWQSGDSRERRFLSYQQETVQKDGIIEMVQSGRSDDVNSIQPTGSVYYLPKSLAG